MAAPRKRRRAVRPSECADYDRTADRPDFVSAFGVDGERLGGDADRAVPLDEGTAEGGELSEELSGEAFYRAQMPPHYGQ